MFWTIIGIVLGTLLGVVLLLFILALPNLIRGTIQKHLHEPRVEKLLSQGNPPTNESILEALRLIRKLDWCAAERAKERIQQLPAAVIRPLALQILEETGRLPARDHWTFSILAEIAGHPIPSESASKIFSHFKKLTDRQWEMMPSLCIVGTAEAARVLTEGIERDTHKFYRHVLTTPLIEAFDTGQMEPGFREQLSEFFAKLCETAPASFDGYDARLWLLVAPERAIERLTRKPFWTSRHSRREILRGLKDISANVREDRLLSLGKILRNAYRTGSGAVHPEPTLLWLLARIKSPHALPLIARLKADDESSFFKDEALEGEAAFAGILQPERIIARHIATHSYAGSLPLFRHLWAMKHLICYLREKNLSRYLLSERGDHWPDALIGLEKAGYAKCAAAIREALLSFGSEGPSTDHHLRTMAMEQLSGPAYADFKSIEGGLHKYLNEGSPWHYIMANADFFRAPQPEDIRS